MFYCFIMLSYNITPLVYYIHHFLQVAKKNGISQILSYFLHDNIILKLF